MNVIIDTRIKVLLTSYAPKRRKTRKALNVQSFKWHIFHSYDNPVHIFSF